MKFRNQGGRQFTKSDIIDIGRALGINLDDRMSVDQIRAKLEASIPDRKVESR